VSVWNGRHQEPALGIIMSIGLAYGLIFITSLFSVGFAYEVWKQRRAMKNAPPPVLISPQQLAHMGAPSVVVTATQEEAFSKVGGAPELPADLTWPQGEKGPREFLAQFDLAEVRRWGGPAWLPATGRIYVFHDEERAGLADHTCVQFSESPSSAAQGSQAAARYPERRVTGRPYTSFPSPDWLGVDGLEGVQEGLDEFVIEPEPTGREGVHRIGGYPSEIQSGQMHIECEHMARGLELDHTGPLPSDIREAANSWRMLLQIDSDRDLKMNWWDAGRFYIFIREDDARAGDFSKTVTISQSY
jgi:hypothetical protein